MSTYQTISLDNGQTDVHNRAMCLTSNFRASKRQPAHIVIHRFTFGFKLTLELTLRFRLTIVIAMSFIFTLEFTDSHFWTLTLEPH